jgi:hypothetical protein
VSAAVTEDDDDIYVYGTVTKQDIVYGAKLAEGKFAMILKTRITIGASKQEVAAKVLRSELLI